MAVKLRLMRMGKTKQPTYRLVAADSRSPRDGRFIEVVGSYDPRHAERRVTVKADRVAQWLKQGAQPTDRVKRILEGEGLIQSAPAKSAAGQADKAGPAKVAAKAGQGQ